MDIRKIEKKDCSWDSNISYGISEMTYKVDNDEPMEEPRIYPITLGAYVRKLQMENALFRRWQNP